MKYLSCEWIESRIVLEMEALKFCCIGHSGHKGYVPMFEYAGGPLPVDRIRAAREELTRQNNDPKVDTGCKGCHFLVNKDWKAERNSDVLFDRVYVSNFSICNLACRYCFVYLREFSNVSNVAGYPLEPIFEEMISKGYLAEDAYVEWGGGEPTIVKGFNEIMKMLLAKGYSQQVHTSSVKFSPVTAEGLRTGKVKAVTSVDSGTRETYLEVKGRDRFEAVWDSIGKYCATGGNMTVKYILRKNNSNDANIRGFFEQARKAGVQKIVLTPDFQEMGQKAVTEETIAAFARMTHLAEQDGISIEIRDELVSPQQMKQLTKYMPWADKRHLYESYVAEEAERQRVLRAERQRRLDSARGETRAAIAQVEALRHASQPASHPFELIERPEPDAVRIQELLEHQIEFPDPALRDGLVRLLADRSVPGMQMLEGATAIGISPDGWTTEGRPGYVLIDASTSDQPVEIDMWFTIWASAANYPIEMRVESGEPAEEIRFTYLEPLPLRVQMPAVPAGESRIFRVQTDKTWTPEGGQDSRRLGVRIATHY